MLLAFGWGSTAGVADGPQTLKEHHCSDDAQKHHIAKLDQQIDLARRFQVVEGDNTKCGTHKPADKQHSAHPEVNSFTPEMRQYAGK